MEFVFRDRGRSLLMLGAGLSLAIAVVHLLIILLGAPAYLYFGAADLAQMARDGSALPAVLTAGLAAGFTVFGLYGLSAAGLVRRLPLLKLAVLFIGGLYTLRGLIVVLDVLRLARGEAYPLRQTVFSAVSLATGLLYLAGLLWKGKE